MTETPGPRFGLAALAGDNFINELDEVNQAQCAILEAKGVRVDRGTLGAQPDSSGSVAGIPDRIYYATDAKTIDYDIGAGWIGLSKRWNYRTGSGAVTAAD